MAHEPSLLRNPSHQGAAGGLIINLILGFCEGLTVKSFNPPFIDPGFLDHHCPHILLYYCTADCGWRSFWMLSVQLCKSGGGVWGLRYCSIWRVGFAPPSLRSTLSSSVVVTVSSVSTARLAKSMPSSLSASDSPSSSSWGPIRI